MSFRAFSKIILPEMKLELLKKKNTKDLVHESFIIEFSMYG